MSRRNEIKEQLGYLSESGLYWLMIDVANTYGLDKKTFEERIAWVDANQGKLLPHQDDADSKWEYINACKAFYDGINDNYVDHMMYLDCTNQALQLYAVVTSCKDTGYLCNVSSGDTLTDAYGELAEAMNQLTASNNFNRDNCKKALMTTLYGKMDGESEIFNWFQDNGIEFPSSIEADRVADIFQSAMHKIAPHAMRAMDALQNLNDENTDVYNWYMPDGFHVKYDVKSTHKIDIMAKTKGGISFHVDKDISIYKGSKFNRGIAPNVIHSIDGYVAREIVRRMSNPNPKFNRTYSAFITSIHDAFATHPNNIDELRGHYTDILVELNNSDILQDIMSQIAGHKVLSIKKNTLTESNIRESRYSLS